MRGEEKERFLSRWSRLKRETREEQGREPQPAPAVDPKAPPPELPPVEQLSIDSDFRGFLHPKVDENLRRTALKKLFADPHFNVMDGLDVYIDDYSKGDPLPAAMLASLKQAQNILEWAKERQAGDAQAAGDAPERRVPDGAQLADQTADDALRAAPSPSPASARAGSEAPDAAPPEPPSADRA